MFRFETLKARLSALALLLVLVAMGAQLVVSLVSARNSMRGAIETNVLQAARAETALIEQWAADKAAAIRGMASAAESADPVPVIRAARTAGEFDLAYIGTVDKKMFAYPPTQYAADYDPVTRPFYKAAIAAKASTMTQPSISAGNGKLVVAFVEPVIRDGKVIAAASGNVALDSLSARLAAVKPMEGAYVFLVDGQGRLLAHPDAKLMLKPLSDLDASLSLDGLAAIKAEDKVVPRSLSGHGVLMAAQAVAGTDWTFVAVVDEAAATAAVNSLLQWNLMVGLIVLVSAFFAVPIVLGRALRRLDHVRDGLVEIASGEADLTRRMDAHGRDELAQIAQAFNRFADSLTSTMKEIRSSSTAVAHAAEEVAAGSRDLSGRSERTAANLEQTAAAMEEVAGTVQQNAASARSARDLTRGAAHLAERGRGVVAEAHATMDEITDASRRIADITSLIDGIAFQTNILALNAAVEAARAGEQGRGFAVVASEVRSLAQRSASAAKEIDELIDDTVLKIRSGAGQVGKAGEVMQEIGAAVERVATVVDEIADASQQQSEGIDEVSKAVSELEQMTQANAALVEESTAASESLKTNAADLNAVVARFRLD